MDADGADRRAPRSPRRASRPATISRSTSSMVRALLKVSVRGTTLDARAFVKSILDGTLVRTNRREGFRPRRQDRERRRRQQAGDHRTWSSPRSAAAARRDSEALRGRIGSGAVTATGSGGETRITTTDAGALAPFRQSLFASRGRRSQSASPLSRRCERRRGDPHRFRPARRTGVSPAGQRRAAARVGGRRRARSMRRSCAFEKMTASFERTPGQAHDPGRRHLQSKHGADDPGR